jgi:hypothetical protein
LELRKLNAGGGERLWAFLRKRRLLYGLGNYKKIFFSWY